MKHVYAISKTMKAAFGAMLCIGLFATAATAAPVTFNFTGAISEVHSSLFPTFNTSQTLTGSYTFNPATVDSNPSANIGRYNGTIQALTVNLGSYTATLGNSGSNFIEIRNQVSSDRYEVRAPLTGLAFPHRADRPQRDSIQQCEFADDGAKPLLLCCEPIPNHLRRWKRQCESARCPHLVDCSAFAGSGRSVRRRAGGLGRPRSRESAAAEEQHHRLNPHRDRFQRTAGAQAPAVSFSSPHLTVHLHIYCRFAHILCRLQPNSELNSPRRLLHTTVLSGVFSPSGFPIR